MNLLSKECSKMACLHKAVGLMMESTFWKNGCGLYVTSGCAIVNRGGSTFSGRGSVSPVTERASLGIVRLFVNLPNFVLNLWAAMLQQFIGSLEEVIFSTSL